MNRRKGQNGTVVIQSGWYRVRWRMDIDGQVERIYMSEKVAPAVIDKTVTQSPHHKLSNAWRGKSSSGRAQTRWSILTG